MPKIILKTVYTFRELLEKDAKGELSHGVIDKVRETLAEYATSDSFWYECLIEQWQEALAQIGFTHAKIHFDGFYHQGSGAAFESTIDKENLIAFLSSPVEPSEVVGTMATDPNKEDFRAWIVKQAGGVRFNPKYRRLLALTDYLNMDNERVYTGYNSEVSARAYKVTAELCEYGHKEPKRILDLLSELEYAADQLRSDLCHAIYTSLRNEYEYRCSDASLLEDADANGWTFDRTGKREG